MPEGATSEKKYILDNNAVIHLEILYKSGKLSIDQAHSLVMFVGENVYEGIPESLYQEYRKNDYIKVENIDTTGSFPVSSLNISAIGIVPQFNFTKERDRGCKSIQLRKPNGEFSKIISPADVEAVSMCLRMSKVFVSGDESAKLLCDRLAIDSISFEDFLVLSKINI